MRISDWSSDVCSSDLLHFTPALLEAIAVAGIRCETLTLHVGAGTFLPVKADDTDDHVMHAEWGRIEPDTAARLNALRVAGGRVLAVGPTSLRDRQSVGEGKRVSVRVDIAGRRYIKKIIHEY